MNAPENEMPPVFGPGAIELRIVVTQPEGNAIRTQMQIRTVGQATTSMARHAIKIKEALWAFLNGLPGPDALQHREKLFFKEIPRRGTRPPEGGSTDGQQPT